MIRHLVVQRASTLGGGEWGVPSRINGIEIFFLFLGGGTRRGTKGGKAMEQEWNHSPPPCGRFLTGERGRTALEPGAKFPLHTLARLVMRPCT